MKALAILLATVATSQTPWNGAHQLAAPEGLPPPIAAESPAAGAYDPSYSPRSGSQMAGDAPAQAVLPPVVPFAAPPSSLPVETLEPRSQRSLEADSSRRTRFDNRASLGVPAPLPPNNRMQESTRFQESHGVAVGGNRQPIDASLALALMSRALQPPEHGAITGTPLTLTEALARGGSANRRQVVDRYWQTIQCLADYHSSLDEFARLRDVNAAQANEAAALVTAAQAAAQARVEAAHVAVVLAQHDLANVTGNVGAALPLPIELPLVAPYQTRLESMYTEGASPAQLRRIHDLLPLVHRNLQAQAEAVAATEEGVQSLGQAAGRGTSVSTILEIHAALRHRRREFFQVTQTYNSYVADYALAVVGNVPEATLAATLVPAPLLPAGQSPGTLISRAEQGFGAVPATHIENGGWQPQPAASRMISPETARASSETRWR